MSALERFGFFSLSLWGSLSLCGYRQNTTWGWSMIQCFALWESWLSPFTSCRDSTALEFSLNSQPKLRVLFPPSPDKNLQLFLFAKSPRKGCLKDYGAWSPCCASSIHCWLPIKWKEGWARESSGKGLLLCVLISAGKMGRRGSAGTKEQHPEFLEVVCYVWTWICEFFLIL